MDLNVLALSQAVPDPVVICKSHKSASHILSEKTDEKNSTE